jgi:hypothetical protein
MTYQNDFTLPEEIVGQIAARRNSPRMDFHRDQDDCGLKTQH